MSRRMTRHRARNFDIALGFASENHGKQNTGSGWLPRRHPEMAEQARSQWTEAKELHLIFAKIYRGKAKGRPE
jgi:hypothetical protein